MIREKVKTNRSGNELVVMKIIIETRRKELYIQYNEAHKFYYLNLFFTITHYSHWVIMLWLILKQPLFYENMQCALYSTTK